MKILESERLILRDFHISDLNDFHEFVSNEKVAHMAGFESRKNKEESLEALERYIAASDDLVWEVQLKELEKVVFWAIELKKLNKVIGWVEACGVTCNLGEKTFKYAKELGFVLSEKFWGQGLIPEAIKRFIDYLFNEENIDVVACSHFVNNSQSKKAIEKCGFKFFLENDNERYYYLINKVLGGRV